MHATLATAQHYYMAYDDQVWSWDCVQMSLDGEAAPPVLPTGSHTFAATFVRCYVDLLVGTWLDGTVSSSYTAADLDDLTALVSASSMRGKLAAFRSDLHDVTADGSGMWTRVRTGTPWTTSWAETTTYTPAIGSTLTNNSTSHVATFGGGSYSSGWGPIPPGWGGQGHEEFDNLVVTVGCTHYTLNGSLKHLYGREVAPSTFSGENSHTGEVQIRSNGGLVARIYGDPDGVLRTEVLGPLGPF